MNWLYLPLPLLDILNPPNIGSTDLILLESSMNFDSFFISFTSVEGEYPFELRLTFINTKALNWL